MLPTYFRKPVIAAICIIVLCVPGCCHKPPLEPIVVIADHVVRTPAGQVFTPQRNGYFLSDEAFIRLLDKLSDLHAELDKLESGTYKLGGRMRADNARPEGNIVALPVQRPGGRQVSTQANQAVQDTPLGGQAGLFMP